MRAAPLLAILVLASAAGMGCRREPAATTNPLGATPPMSATVAGGPVAASETVPLEQVAKSQAAVVGQRIANTEITLTYSRPVARGRDLFGKLVPYDEAWNPGADEATAVTLSRDITVNGVPLAKGAYSLWMIPRPRQWTVIFSRAAKVFHIPYPDEKEDAVRLEVQTESGPHMEALEFDFPTVEGKDTVLRLRWGTVVVPLAIRVQ